MYESPAIVSLPAHTWLVAHVHKCLIRAGEEFPVKTGIIFFFPKGLLSQSQQDYLIGLRSPCLFLLSSELPVKCVSLPVKKCSGRDPSYFLRGERIVQSMSQWGDLGSSEKFSLCRVFG